MVLLLLLVPLSGLLALGASSARAAHRNPAVIAELPIGSHIEAGMAVDETRNRVYVTDGVSSVTVIDGAKNEVLATVPIGPGGPSGTIVDLAFNPITNRLYATFSDTSAGALLVVIDGANYSVLGNIVLGGTAAGNVTVNPATNRVYVYGFSPSLADPETNPAGTGVFVVDAPTPDFDDHRVLDGIPVRHCAVSAYAPVQVNPRTNQIYLTETGCLGFLRESLLVIDPNTHEVSTIPLDQNSPYYVAVECPTWPAVECPPSKGEKVFVSSAPSSPELRPTRISVVDSDAMQVVRTVDGVFGDVGFNPTTDRLYATYFDETGFGFAAIDPERGVVLRGPPWGHGSAPLAVNAVSDRVYLADAVIGDVDAAADLALTKADSPDPVVVGERLTYTLTVTNNGPTEATGVTLTDTLPGGVDYVSADPDQGSCRESDRTVSCDLGALTAGASTGARIVVTPIAPGTPCNTASVDADQDDPISAEECTTVEPAGPALSIGDVAVDEGDVGLTEAVFQVSLSAPSTERVTVDYTTANGTAAEPGDYTATSSPPALEFAPGETRKPITVPVVGDTLEEPDETFTVQLSNPTNARTTDGEGLGTIRDDDPSSTCTKLQFGDDPTPGRIEPPGETDCFRFDGGAGELVRVRLLESPPGGPFDPGFEVLDPDGDPVPGCRASIDFPVVCELPKPGTYTILVEDSSGPGTNTGGYLISIQRLNPPLLCAEAKLQFGDDPTPGSIVPSGETDCFRFDGGAGELVRVRLLESPPGGPSDPLFELRDPDGDPVPGCRASIDFPVVCELPKPGTYTILVEDSSGPGTNTGGYLISIQRLNPPLLCAEPRLRLGDPPTPGRIEPPGETDCFRFDGAAGTPVRVRLRKTSSEPLNPAFELRDPDGDPVPGCLGRVTSDDFTCTPALSGTHTILVDDASGPGLNSGDYSIQLGDGPPLDQVPPAITLRTPPDGAEYPRGARVVADYECSDEAGGSGLASCAGTVPDGEPIDTATLGAKEFTVLARDNQNNQSSVTHRYTVIDDTAPTITLRTPPDGATYTLNQDVNADYDCADESGGSGLASCGGTVPDGAPIDTATLGVKDFTVTARDNAGNQSSVTHQYRITPRDFSAPRVEIRMPQGTAYAHQAVVLADYECEDEAGGSGLASCAGPVADGDPIDTATLGAKQFTVIARDNAGNQTSVGVGYLVIDLTPPTITLRSPPDGAVYDVGQEVRADYECADDSGGAGLASCVGPVADGDPIDTATAGPKSFTVTARDHVGNERSITHRYTVSAPPRPVCDGVPATIVVPPDSGPVSGTPGADVIVGSEGSDVISGRGGADRICGHGGADQLTGDGGKDRLFGGLGADELRGARGDDTLSGGGGKDDLGGGSGDDDLHGGGGDDRLSGDGDHDELGGGDGDDRLSGDDGNDAASGGGGKDLLLGRDGNDLLFGGDGLDDLRGGAGNDRAQGERGDDQLGGGPGNDRLFGGAGDDDIDGGPGRDFCRGGRDADTERNCEA